VAVPVHVVDAARCRPEFGRAGPGRRKRRQFARIGAVPVVRANGPGGMRGVLQRIVRGVRLAVGDGLHFPVDRRHRIACILAFADQIASAVLLASLAPSPKEQGIAEDALARLDRVRFEEIEAHRVIRGRQGRHPVERAILGAAQTAVRRLMTPAVAGDAFRQGDRRCCAGDAGTPGACVPTTKVTIANEIAVIIDLRIIVSSRSSIVGNDL